jgi:hypothetical protein
MGLWDSSFSVPESPSRVLIIGCVCNGFNRTNKSICSQTDQIALTRISIGTIRVVKSCENRIKEYICRISQVFRKFWKQCLATDAAEKCRLKGKNCFCINI